MRRLLHTLLVLMFSSVLLYAQDKPITCSLGFTFQIGANPNWGENEPIIIEVTPGSPADEAGLKRNDIILEVNGHGTYLKPAHTIMSWFEEKDSEMLIGIRNFEFSFKQLAINKNCRLRNAISEAQLTPVFSFYSLEDIQDRKFVIPITTKLEESADFYNYRTFDFSPIDESTRHIDERINAIILKNLQEIGLKHDKEDPDFLIQTFYSYQSNPMYNEESAKLNTDKYSWRFDTRNNKMVRIPVYDATRPVKINDVMFDLEFGYRIYDRKFTEPGAPTMVFESEVKEKMSTNYGLLEYLELNLPLMLMKFPNNKDKSIGKYHVKFSRFNYTGISYDMNDLRTVVSVDPNSPAAKAGIMPGDIVDRVRGNSFNHTAKSLTDSYRRFIAETMKYRDQNTKYTDANGYSNAMYWDISNYYTIAKEISENKQYKSGFSYLFSFNQYIDWELSPTLMFDVNRNGKKIAFEILPTIKRHTQIIVE